MDVAAVNRRWQRRCAAGAPTASGREYSGRPPVIDPAYPVHAVRREPGGRRRSAARQAQPGRVRHAHLPGGARCGPGGRRTQGPAPGQRRLCAGSGRDSGAHKSQGAPRRGCEAGGNRRARRARKRLCVRHPVGRQLWRAVHFRYAFLRDLNPPGGLAGPTGTRPGRYCRQRSIDDRERAARFLRHGKHPRLQPR